MLAETFSRSGAANAASLPWSPGEAWEASGSLWDDGRACGVPSLRVGEPMDRLGATLTLAATVFRPNIDVFAPQ
jgi:hypothetical protein